MVRGRRITITLFSIFECYCFQRWILYRPSNISWMTIFQSNSSFRDSFPFVRFSWKIDHNIILSHSKNYRKSFIDFKSWIYAIDCLRKQIYLIEISIRCKKMSLDGMIQNQYFEIPIQQIFDRTLLSDKILWSKQYVFLFDFTPILSKNHAVVCFET